MSIERISKKIVMMASVVLLAACASAPEVPSKPTSATCHDPRPAVCTMIYDPVCATTKAGLSKTYSSPCNACAHDHVQSWVLGKCDA